MVKTNFYKDQVDNSSKEIAKIHKYWARKPISIIDIFIKKYSEPNDYVLDPFCGSGTFGLSSSSLNRQYVGYDLNPISNLICKVALRQDKNIEKLNQEFIKLEKNVKDKILELYKFKDSYIKYQVNSSSKKKNKVVLTDANFSTKSLKVVFENIPEKKIDLSSISIPNNIFPEKFYKDRFSYKGYSKVSDFYSSRNLKSLEILFNEINQFKNPYKNIFLLSFTNTLLHVSKLKSENVRPLSVNNYWLPEDHIEENVWWRFEERYKRQIEGQSFIKNNYKLLTKSKIYLSSGIKLKNSKPNSIDYVITDPPYGDVIQYSELSFIWNTWLGKDFKNDNELIINPKQNKNNDYFITEFETFIKKIKSILKKNKYFTLCFHNKNLSIWIELLKVIYFNGFNLIDISVFNTHGNSYNTNWSKFSPKSDFYLTFQNKKLKKSLKNNISFKDLVKKVKLSKNNISDSYDLLVSEVIKNIFIGNDVTDIEDDFIKKYFS